MRPAASFGNAAGHPVLHSANTYAIFWDPQDFYHGDRQGLIDNYLRARGRLKRPAEQRLRGRLAVHRRDATSPLPAVRCSTEAPPTPIHIRPRDAATRVRLKSALRVVTAQVCLTDTDVRAELQTYIPGSTNCRRGMEQDLLHLDAPGRGGLPRRGRPHRAVLGLRGNDQRSRNGRNEKKNRRAITRHKLLQLPLARSATATRTRSSTRRSPGPPAASATTNSARTTKLPATTARTAASTRQQTANERTRRAARKPKTPSWKKKKSLKRTPRKKTKNRKKPKELGEGPHQQQPNQGSPGAPPTAASTRASRT